MDKHIEEIGNTYGYKFSKIIDRRKKADDQQREMNEKIGRSNDNIKTDFSDAFRYFIFDDKDNKRWLIYDRKDECYLSPYPYGDITVLILNTYKSCMDTSKRYDEQVNVAVSGGSNKSAVDKIGDLAKRYEKEIDDIFKICSGDKTTDTQDLYNFWLLFRYAPNEKFTSSILSYAHETLDDYYDEFSDFISKEDIKNLFSPSRAYEVSHEYEDVYLDNCIPYCGIQLIEYDRETLICDCRAADDFLDIFYFDLFYMLFGKGQRQMKVCKWCGSLFFSEKNSEKYCPWCSHKENARKIANANRKNNSCRYLHKKICDSLTQARNRKNNPVSDADYQAFRKESNYYWAVVSGKQPPKVSRYTANIQTEDDYIAWLEKQKIKYSIKGTK